MPTTLRLVSFSAELTFMLVARSAGAMPKIDARQPRDRQRRTQDAPVERTHLGRRAGRSCRPQ